MERVLIVEDDENIRQLLKLTLASFNYELVVLKMEKMHMIICKTIKWI